ncbi:YgiQ family radical SAM protein [Fusobacterium sp.]|uniref:YgiQ family radical SAM protein n=1 Tax=Fusobacterium sp. TaxID=68766 RepID=UPI0025BFF506|nr:YgiQ family radical SAM protein [Fusobacterium sp.]MCI5725548.1 YgiQ family radical SAM protein [Fusobacterium sp.]MCI7224483.1 YgiQ family radical SAM protein [Fusobacterium sp.]MDD7392559.1 YgiQ family radical SAM protein [Fusobacteriaceae bacterium]
MKFLPTTREEMNKLGWDSLDVLLISGDTYLDTSYNGSALVGKWLVKHGFRVGIIAQPEIDNPVDITRLGEPNLFFAVSGGCVDSMVANYTATKKRRQQDDFTPGGINNKRPDRAVLVYSNMIRRFFKGTDKKIVISGIESSLRRITHYDYWTNKLRKPILFDAKADILSYGMGEMSMLQLARALKNGEDWKNIRGLCYISKEDKEEYLKLPSHQECLDSKDIFAEAFHNFYLNCDPITAKGLVQKCDDRYMIQNPPSLTYSEKEMDEIYSMEFARDVHPYYKQMGAVKALDTIKYSVTTHRGCYGECNFCAIAIHQGRTVMSRSQDSIINEVKEISNIPKFHGNIADVGGPTANMYGVECKKKLKLGSCPDRRCLYPKKCPALIINHNAQIELLKKLKTIPKIKKIFIASGIRYDMILDDNKCGQAYLKELVKDHISGQMKIAPEHTEDSILSLMGKDGKSCLNEFKNRFYKLNEELGKKQFLTYYLIAAHPGCREKEMMDLKKYASKELRVNPEQVQIFTPTPSTYSTLMYYIEKDPFTGKKLFVEKDNGRKQKQKDIVIEKKTKK